ncbi:MAG: alpha/beta hydrolase family protein [Planctomycetota bacterium]|jgi:pimeloyl-ACP methyl ester carboxylesterase
MNRHEDLTVELNRASLRGTLDLPAPPKDNGPAPVVLLCHGLPALSTNTGELLEEVSGALMEAGLAVAGFGPGAATASEAPGTARAVDEASAMLHALALRDDLDLNRIGVLGYSLGGIVAACLSKRTDQIARLCLLAPLTTDELAARLANESDNQVASRLGGTEVPSGFFDAWKALTPTDDLVAHDRPTLILHGAADRTVPPEESLKYRRAVEQAGHRVDHVLVARADHAFTRVPARTVCLDHLTRFFAAAPHAPGPAERP